MGTNFQSYSVLKASNFYKELTIVFWLLRTQYFGLILWIAHPILSGNFVFTELKKGCRKQVPFETPMGSRWGVPLLETPFLAKLGFQLFYATWLVKGEKVNFFLIFSGPEEHSRSLMPLVPWSNPGGLSTLTQNWKYFTLLSKVSSFLYSNFTS